MLTHLRTVQDWVIKPAMRTVPGTAEINGWGGYEKQYQVRIDPKKLLHYGVSFDQVMQAVRRTTSLSGGGNIQQAGAMYPGPRPGPHGQRGRDQENRRGHATRRACRCASATWPRSAIGHDIRLGGVTSQGTGRSRARPVLHAHGRKQPRGHRPPQRPSSTT